ncbi:MAG: VWA domain-containing protein [Planctomycetes bacterium]|nr:VWA domain-containing protein [Planctomycetota bacterium]
MKRVLSSLLALLFLARFAAADGFMQVTEPGLTPIAVKYHRVEVTIDNQVATTEIDQVFVNPNGRQIEATYMFPVPAGASISKLSMWINGVEQEAELLDADKARNTYEQIVRSMQDPALLEYVGQKMFKLRVFPILPNEEKRVKLAYSETIKADGGLCIYRYPLNTEKFSSKPLEECRVSVKVKSNVPLKSLMSPTHPVDVARKSDFEGTAVFEATNATPDKDFLLYFTQQDGDFGMNLVAQRGAGEDGYFMLLVSPRAEATDAEVVKRDVCFVLDTSMSMAEQDRMPQAKKALKAGLQTLNVGDRFNIVAFSTEARKWKEQLVECTQENLVEAGTYIDGLRARGGTNISDAMSMALAMNAGDAARPYMVIFMTDGEPTLGETDPEKIVKITRDANKANARIFTLGVGFDLNVNLLDRIAEENKGLREYITPTENLEIKMAGYYEKIGAPVLADVKLELQGEGTEIYDTYPKALADVFKGQQIAVFGRFKADGSRSIKLKGSVNGKPREFVYEAGFPKESASHDSIPRLWAISKIGHLMDAIRLNGEKEELKKEIVALAKEFGVMTKYTSWLVLEDNARIANRPAGAPAPGAPADRAWGGRRGDMPAEEAEKLDDGREALGAGGGEGGVAASKALDKMKSGEADHNEGFFERKKRQQGQEGKGDAVTTIGDRTFYQVDGVWMDQKAKGDVKTTKVEYLSDEYFKLLKEKPELGKYFALGDRLVVMVGDAAFEVVPAAKK